MAGDWIKVRVDLHEDAAVIATATDLGRSENEIVGALVRLWGWADRQTRDGNARGVTSEWIDRYIGVTGFAHTLARHGWLTLEADGFAIPKFERHNGTTGKARASGKNRVREHRERRLCDGPVTDVKRSGNGPDVTSALPEKRREEKRREEENTPPTPKGERARKEWDGQLPAALDVPAFRDAWTLWEQERRARGKRLTDNARRLQWQRCEEWGVEAAVRSISDSIANQWTGLFPPKGDATPRQARPDRIAEAFGNLFPEDQG